ncbi:MAG: YciI family protein [Amnibacterium sp.]
MPNYLMTIYVDETAPQPTGDEVSASYRRFMERRAGALRGGAALEAAATATSLRRDGDGFAITDGPFAEAKEVLGGYYVVEAADLDEALAIAKEIPAGVGVEVRPIRVLS